MNALEHLANSLEEHDRIKQRIRNIEHTQSRQVVMLKDANRRYRKALNKIIIRCRNPVFHNELDLRAVEMLAKQTVNGFREVI